MVALWHSLSCFGRISNQNSLLKVKSSKVFFVEPCVLRMCLHSILQCFVLFFLCEDENVYIFCRQQRSVWWRETLFGLGTEVPGIVKYHCEGVSAHDLSTIPEDQHPGGCSPLLWKSSPPWWCPQTCHFDLRSGTIPQELSHGWLLLLGEEM